MFEGFRFFVSVFDLVRCAVRNIGRILGCLFAIHWYSFCTTYLQVAFLSWLFRLYCQNGVCERRAWNCLLAFYVIKNIEDDHDVSQSIPLMIRNTKDLLECKKRDEGIRVLAPLMKSAFGPNNSSICERKRTPAVFFFFPGGRRGTIDMRDS